MRLCDALQVAPGDLISIVGAGGKTRAMYRLASELASQGLRVVVTTTTMIRAPSSDSVSALVVEEDASRLLKATEAALRDCLDAEGPAVIVSRRECALLPEARRQWMTLTVDAERCNGCGLCFQVGCPAISKSEVIDERSGRAKARIDPLLCTGCEICAQVCARRAILFRNQLPTG